GSYLKVQKTAMRKLGKRMGKELIACVLLDAYDSEARSSLPADNKAVIVECDFTDDTKIQKALKPYQHRFLAVTCRAEKNIPLLKKVVPHVPYLHTPTERSLDWTTDKIKMRQMLRSYDSSIAPK